MKEKIALLLATWFGSGLIPPIILKGMAGTYGTFFSLPLCYFLVLYGRGMCGLWLGVIIILYVIGVAVVPVAERALGPRTDWKGKTKHRDQNQIVIDETLGIVIACLPLGIIEVDSLIFPLLAAFVLFRIFDIVKIPPTRFFDRMHNAHGVMLDDVIAGIYAAVCLFILLIALQ